MDNGLKQFFDSFGRMHELLDDMEQLVHQLRGALPVAGKQRKRRPNTRYHCVCEGCDTHFKAGRRTTRWCPDCRTKRRDRHPLPNDQKKKPVTIVKGAN